MSLGFNILPWLILSSQDVVNFYLLTPDSESCFFLIMIKSQLCGTDQELENLNLEQCLIGALDK